MSQKQESAHCYLIKDDMTDIPASMRAELGEWNNGKGIDLEAWIGCEGRFSLAVGYLAIFWPSLELVDGHIVHQGVDRASIKDWASQPGSSRRSVETILNHRHLVDIQHTGCSDCSADKLLKLGYAQKEIYEAKLKWQFPDRPCEVSFFIPEDSEALEQYEITFWQIE